MAGATAGVFVKDLHKLAVKGISKSRRSWAREKLKELGVNWENELTNSDIKTAMERFARKTQLQKDILKDPLIFNNPQTRVFTQFKRFGYRQYQYSKNLLINDFKRGNIFPILRMAAGGMAGGAFVGWARNEIKSLLSGESQVDQSPGVIPKNYNDVIENIASVGALGMIGDLMSASVEEGKSVSRAVKFIATPAFVDDINNFFERFIAPMESDFETFRDGAFRRAPVRALRLPGGILRETSKRIETPGMTMERIKGMRSNYLGKVLAKLLKAKTGDEYGRIFDEVKAWNESYPEYPITGEDINNKALYRRKMRKYKRQALEK